MTAILEGAHAECALIKKIPSRQVVQLVLELPSEYFARAAQMFDGKSVWVEVAPPQVSGMPYAVITSEQPDPPAVSRKKHPFGDAAAILYRHNVWLAPPVLAAIGTDEEFLEWIRQQPCAMTGRFDYHKDEAMGVTTERCEAAHVRRIAAGAGMAEKPPWSAIPLIHLWHDAQTRLGERVFDTANKMRPNPAGDPAKGRAWMDIWRARYVSKWAAWRLACQLDGGKTPLTHKESLETSIGDISPVDVMRWAKENNVDQYVPAEYRRIAENT